ncbi:hypothetical protein KSS87_003212 [Heliosperma pusillum]|nr:hypothetical protein KSS87_003212 [Heliosperma pusillum]
MHRGSIRVKPRLSAPLPGSSAIMPQKRPEPRDFVPQSQSRPKALMRDKSSIIHADEELVDTKNIKLTKVRGSSESVPPPSPTPSSNPFPGFPGVTNNVKLIIIAELDKDIQTLEDAVEVVEKVADEVEKLAEDVVEDLPQGKLKNVVAKVEHVAELVAEAAHLADSAIDKVQELEEEAASFVAKEEANFDKKRDSVHGDTD